MAAIASGSTQRKGSMQGIEHKAEQAENKARPLRDFWQKVTFDWVSLFSGALAYSFLTSIIPLLLVIIAIGGFIVGSISPGSAQQLQTTIQNALPSGIGKEVVAGALNTLHRSAGLLLVIGIVSALFTGSRLFVAIENTAGVVFRLRGRDPLHQNIMAIGMTIAYVVLVPLTFAASVLPGKLLHVVGLPTDAGFGALVAEVLGILVSVLVAFILFAAIFVVVPNRPVRVKEAWKGALFTAVALVLYELLFPLYTTYLIKPGNYGSLAGFALVFLAFFYYLAFFLLLGMEINSWLSGQRQTASDVASIIHEVQAHNTTRGAAGPTAGTPQEDQQNHKGAAVMKTDASAIQHEREDHHDDAKPPKYAEADKNEAHAGSHPEADTAAGPRADAQPVRDNGTRSAVKEQRPQMHPSKQPARRATPQSGGRTNAVSVATARPLREPTRPASIRADVQKVLLAGLVVGAGRLATMAFGRLRHRNSTKA